MCKGIEGDGGPGGHSPGKVVRVCPAVKIPFSRLSCHSLDPSCSMIQFFRSPTLEQE